MNRRFLYIIFLFASCTSQLRLNNIDFAGQFSDVRPHATYKVRHLNTDSSVIYYSIDSKSLLYKKNEAGNYESRMRFSYSLYPSGSKTSMIDSTLEPMTVSYDSLAVYFNGEVCLKVPSGSDYYLVLFLTDVFRNQTFNYGTAIKKSDDDAASWFDVRDENGRPMLDDIVKPGERFYILPQQGMSRKMFLRAYFRDFPLASPPFATGSFRTFDFHSDSTATVNLDDALMFNRKGIYYLQHDTSKSGIAFFCATAEYPAITTAGELIQSLRYLSTREEFDKLSHAADVKKAVDDYWLEKAGNNERGRMLIRTYYGRAQDANRLFTSYLEGWKTDRGMIYIIFGPPKTVYRNGDDEYWRYDFTRGMPDVQFIFSNVKNPFTENDYQLIRDPGFQNLWYMAVDSWRSGRIVGEY